MGTAGLVLFAFSLAQASEIEVCVENPARVDSSVMQVFRKELSAILAESGRVVTFTSCHAGAITLTFRQSPPDEETSALAGIRVRDGRFVPEIDVFVGAVSNLLPSGLSVLLGRALARVATHELGHWLTRSASHADCGVMMERLTAAHLIAPDRGFFRLPQAAD